jgi:hypothetical protein
MKERHAVTKAMAAQYRRASKKGKAEILDPFVEATGYDRSYAAGLLRHCGQRVEVAPGVVLEGSMRVKRPCRRAPTYGPEELKALTKVWKIMDYICGKRLAPQLPELIPLLVRQGTLRVSGPVRDKLMGLSAATIDRLLAPERRKTALKGRSRTKPGTLLKHQIPVRTFADWNEVKPGFMEMDLVAHDGGSSHGEYCQILDVTDVCTGWSEQLAVPTKAQCWVFEAIQEMRTRLPFALLGLDSDNGGEFINHQLAKYCKEEAITFTRSRASKKNDNCYVEQKNWSIVRRFSGYDRYEGDEACRELNALYAVVRDYVNFFMPSMKLIEKVRDGARVRKRYDKAQTPYQRLLASPHVSRTVKTRLRKRYAPLNPAQLKGAIDRSHKRLRTLAIRLRDGTPAPPKPAANHPWRITADQEKNG